MIYRFKVTFDTLKGFMRRYELRGDDTLYDFHAHIVDDLHFAPDQMVLFRSLDAKGNTIAQYGLFDMGDGTMDNTTIDTLAARGETLLLYVFDLRDERALRLTFEQTDEALPRKSYPRTSDEKGTPPPQFADRKNTIDYEDDIEEAADDLADISETGLAHGE